MHSVETQITEELLRILRQTEQLEQFYLNQVLALESILNNIHKTNIIRHDPKKNDLSAKINQPQVKQINRHEVQSKIQQIINEVDLQQKYIESQIKDKPKPFQNKIEPIIQKKPPLPTVNRIDKNTSKNIVPKYVPPRNKNQITAKVTQTIPINKNQRIIKRQNPVSHNMRRPDSKEEGKKKNQSKQQIKSNKSIEKKMEKTIQPKIKPPQQSIKPIVQFIPKKQNSIKKEQNKPQQIQKQSQIQTQSQNIKLVSMNRSIEEIVQEINDKRGKDKKELISKLIQQCQKQQKGYRQKQEKSRHVFLKHFCNLSATRSKLPLVTTHSIPKRHWDHCPYTFDFIYLLNDLQNQVNELLTKKDCRIDPKQQYRTLYFANQLTQQIQNIIEKGQSEGPDKLNLTFDFKEIKKDVDSKQKQKKTKIIFVDQQPLYQKIMVLLNELTNSATFTKQQLTRLRVLSEIGVFNLKRSPMIVTTEQYNEWKQYYK